MNSIMFYQFAGNEIWRYGLLFISILLTFILNKLICFSLNQRIANLKENKRIISIFLKSFPVPLKIISIYLGISLIKIIIKFPDNFPESLQNIFDHALDITIAIAIAIFVYRLVDIVEFYLGKITTKTETQLDDMLVPLFRKTLRVVIVIILGLHIMETISGKPVTTLLAGLGLGGLAVALAAQDTIKNLFGTLMILSDQPFKVGDRIVVDDIDGPVEDVGFRSTKIRTLTGNLVTIPNDKLINANITNISKRPYIRRLANITITYDTPLDKIRQAVESIEDILTKHSENFPADFPPRVYFNDFNDCSLNILVIYWYAPPAYWDFLEFNQMINLEIMKAFESLRIEFAFPTQTIYLAGDEKRKLSLNMLQQN